MKTIITLLLFISQWTTYSQSANVAGDYSLTLGTKDNSQFKYQLTLHQDGTFFFHYYSNIKNGIPPEVNKYG